MKLLLIIVPVMLAGCASHDRDPAAEVDVMLKDYQSRLRSGAADAALTGTPHDVQGYAFRLRHDILQNIPAPEQYAGQSCSLRTWFTRAGQPAGIGKTEGDPAACQAVSRALTGMALPPFADETIWQQFYKVTLDFVF